MGGGDGGGGKYDKWAVHQSQLEAKKMSSPSKPAKAAAALWGEKDKNPGGDGRGDWSHCVWRSVGSCARLGRPHRRHGSRRCRVRSVFLHNDHPIR